MSESPDRVGGASGGVAHRSVTALMWMFTGTGAQAALRIISLIVLARVLTPEDFGIMGAALVVIGLAALLSQLGVGPALVQRTNLEPRHMRTAFTISVALSISVGVLVAVGAPLVARFFRMPELTSVLRVVALLFPLEGLATVPDALMRRNLRFRTYALIETASVGVGFVAVSVVLAWVGFGVWSLVAAHIVQRSIMTSGLLAFQRFPKRPQIDRCALKDLLTFGGGFTIARVFNYVALRGDYIIAGRWLGAASLGIYTRAYQLLVFPVNLFASALDRVLFPFMAVVQEDPVRLGSAYRRGNAAIALAFLPLSTFAIVLAPEIVEVALGAQWLDVIEPFQILAAGMMFRAGYKVSDSLARATGAVYRRAWRQGIYAAAVLAGGWLGQYYWGLNGLAAGVLVAIIVNYFLMNQLSLALTSSNWADFFASHVPALRLAVLALLESLVMASALRSIGAHPLVVLIGATVLVAGTQLVLGYRFTAVFGPDGKWLMSILRERVSDYRTRGRPAGESEPPAEDTGGADHRGLNLGSRGDENRGQGG